MKILLYTDMIYLLSTLKKEDVHDYRDVSCREWRCVLNKVR